MVNDLAFYGIMEAFLEKELGGRFRELGDAVKNPSALILEGKDLIEGLRDRNTTESYRQRNESLLNILGIVNREAAASLFD